MRVKILGISVSRKAQARLRANGEALLRNIHEIVTALLTVGDHALSGQQSAQLSDDVTSSTGTPLHVELGE